jgi:hypothetical protein
MYMCKQLELFPEFSKGQPLSLIVSTSRGHLSVTAAHISQLYLCYFASRPLDVVMSYSDAAKVIASPNYAQFWIDAQATVLESDTSLSRNLAKMIKDLDVKVYINAVAHESGLASQAHGSPRLAAKSLRREAMKPRGSKGR